MEAQDTALTQTQRKHKFQRNMTHTLLKQQFFLFPLRYLDLHLLISSSLSRALSRNDLIGPHSLTLSYPLILSSTRHLIIPIPIS